MEYIRGPKGKDCIFCEYAHAGAVCARKNLVLHSSEHAYVVMNRYPFASGHLLVVPNRHASDLGALPDQEYSALFSLVRATVERLRRALRAEGINVGINLGDVAGAGIAEHLHVHVVPRWKGDTNFMPVLADVRVMPQHLEETYQELVPFFADFRGRTADV
jgi:ATP adenylyltransferase